MRISKAAGVSLVEVLITICILSFGALGIAGMQASAIANTHLAYQYSQAALLAQSIAEDLRANPTAVMAGLYQHSADANIPPASNDCSKQVCTPSELAAWNMATWQAHLSDNEEETPATNANSYHLGLAGAKLSISCQESCRPHSIQFITIYWDARRNGATGTGCNPSSLADLICFRLAYTS